MEEMTLAELRQVSKPETRRGECRYSVVEGDRVVKKIAKARLSALIVNTVAPRVERGQTVEVRWSHPIRPGMSPWAKVVTVHEKDDEPDDEDPRISQEKEPDLGVKDGRDILHIIPSGYFVTTRCGIDVEYGAMIPVPLSTNLPHCPTCWAEPVKG